MGVFEILLRLRHEKSQPTIAPVIIHKSLMFMKGRVTCMLKCEYVRVWLLKDEAARALLRLCSHLYLTLSPLLAPQPTHRPSLSRLLYGKVLLTWLCVAPTSYFTRASPEQRSQLPPSLPLLLSEAGGWLGCASHPVGKSKSREANRSFPLRI